MGQEPKLSYSVLSKSNFEKFVRDLLLVKQYRVEVYSKANQTKNAEWILEYKGSPGNLSQFEEILFENIDAVVSTAVMGIKMIKNNVSFTIFDEIKTLLYAFSNIYLFNLQTLAIGCVNTTESFFHVAEINDNEFFTELEGLIAQVGPKECILPSGYNKNYQSLYKVLGRNNVCVSEVKKSEFSAGDVIQDLNRLLYFTNDQERNALSFSETKLTEAMSSLQAVIKYLNLTGDDQNYNQYKITPLEISRYVRLDNAAISALNLLPTPGEAVSKSNKYMSVFGVLDSCCTAQGKRLLEQWIKQPLRDVNLINERLDIVEAFLNDSETRNTLHMNSLTRVPDLLKLSKKLYTKKITLQDCYRIYQAVSSLPYLLEVLKKPGNKSIFSVLINPISELVLDMEKYQLMIEQTLDFDAVEKGEYLIKPKFDDELDGEFYFNPSETAHICGEHLQNSTFLFALYWPFLI